MLASLSKSQDAKGIKPRLPGSITQGLAGLFPVSLGKGHFKWEEQCVQRPRGLVWLVSLRNSCVAGAECVGCQQTRGG